MKQVLVLGATGETGSRVVAALRAKNIPVRVFVRNGVKAEVLGSEGVDVVVGDFHSEVDLGKALDGVGALISTLGAKLGKDSASEVEFIEFTIIDRLAQLAAAKGLEHIVFCSSLGTEAPDSAPTPALVTLLRLKLRSEQALQAGTVPYTIVRPGYLVNEPGGQNLTVARTVKAMSKMPREDLAEVLVQALLQPGARNKVVEVVQGGAAKANQPHLFG